MSNKSLGNADPVPSMLRDDSVLIEVDGAIRRIRLDDLMDSINSGQQQLLRQVAWGVPIKQDASSPDWGVIGNRQMWTEYKSHIGRFLLTNAGNAAKLSAQDSSVFADGTALDETKGHVMFIAPRLYYLVQTDAVTGVPTLWMSQIPIGGHYIEQSCFGAYMGSMSGTAFTSRSNVKPTGSKTINAFWNAAQVNGANFGLQSYDHRKLMVMLLLSEFGNPNCQSKIGYGVGGSVGKDLWATASTFLTGATQSNGDACVANAIDVVNGEIVGVDCSRVSLFGIEDPWGWMWEMVQGIFFGTSGNAEQDGTEAFIYDGNRMPTTDELASHPTGDFRRLTKPSTSGYIKQMILGEFFDILPAAIGGGSTSYWCDYYYANGVGQLGLWGGYASHGPNAGLGFASANAAWSLSHSTYGSRLAYYGKISFMSGAELMAIS